MSKRARVWARWRDALRERPAAEVLYRAIVAVVGLLVLTLGIVAIPYPGPGWAIVFVGLGVLASEFAWARHVLAYAKRRYNQVMDWFWAQGRWVQAVGALFTGAVVVSTLWVLGALGWAAQVVGLEWPWLRSPLAAGS